MTQKLAKQKTISELMVLVQETYSFSNNLFFFVLILFLTKFIFQFIQICSQEQEKHTTRKTTGETTRKTTGEATRTTGEATRTTRQTTRTTGQTTRKTSGHETTRKTTG